MGLHTNLWERALDSLSPDIQKSFDRTKTHKRDIVAAVLEEAEAKRALSLRKRWKFTKPNGEVVIVRDVLEKIISWVQRFKETGDTIIQYDPAHAALPWAAVRFLLQMTVSEVQTFAAMADDPRILVRYRLFEGLYLRGSQSEIELKLEDALTRLYAEILVHLSNAWTARVLKSPFRTFDEARAKSMVEREQEVDAFASLSDAETLRSLEAAFTRLSSQSSQSLSEDGFNQILEWLSVVPYYHHHQFIAQSRLPGAGQWLLKHEKFTDWKISSSSALLLLHGIPGSGKSTLCSVVVDSLLSATGANQAAAPLGYFYCANPHSEKSRRSADDIMRTLLFQLAIDTAHRTKMRDFLCSEYERQMALARAGRMDMAKLRVKDCVRLILELAEQDPLTIVLDGLDSVDESEKPTIIEALEELISKADNVVKIFVTSRSTSRSGAKPTSKFPIQITSQETQSDMEAFVDHLVENAVASKVLLEGRIRPETRHMLRHALLAGSDEMFLWAKLQLEQFCRQAVEDDIMAALQDKLPQDINLLYQESLNHIFNAGEMARNIAVRVLSCILYMKEPSTPGALLTALAAGKNSALELSQVLAMCADLVVLDTKCNVIRVAHQSVQDFLMRHEAFTPAAAHTYLASFCVEVCSRGINSASGRALEIPSEDFYIYAAMYWPVHSRIAMRLEKDTSQTEAIVGDVKLFIFDEDWETTLCFDTWVGNVRNLIPILSRDHAMNPALDAVPQSDLGFLFVLSIFGLDCILREALLNITDVDVNQKNELGHTPVYLAAALGEPETVSTLVDCGANVNVNCGKYGSPLHAACFMGHLDVVDKLLQLGAEVSCGSVFKNAMQAACRGGREDVALLLIGLDSMIESEDDYEEALGEATLVGFVRVVQRLHLSRFASPTTKSSENTKKKIERSIQGGQVGVLRQFLGHSAGNGNLLPSDAVARATLHNHRDLVEFLLGQGMDVEAEGDFGSPLRTASLLNYQSLVRLLLDKGAQIDSYGPFGDSLQAAALNGHTSIVRLLIQEGAKVDQKTGFYGSALQAAAYHGHANAVELLLDAQGEICGPEVVEDAFHAAAEGGHQGIITLMLRKGFKFYYPPAGPYCNVTITPSPYEALLGNASPRRHQRRDQLASRQNSETENKDGTKRSITNMDAIFRATLSDFGPLQSGTGEDSNINETSHTRHHSALSAAASLGHEDAVKVILEQQEVLCISSETVDRAAVDAAANGQMAIVYLLLDRVASRRPVKPLIEQALVVAHHRQQANVVEGVLSLASQHCSEKELSGLKRKIYTAAERVQSGELSRESLVADFAYGCEIGDIQTVTAILDGKHHELFSRREVDGGLQIGALYGNATLVELLLKSPALRDRLPESGEEVFVLAAAGGFVQVMRLLGSHWDQLLMPATDAVRRALTVASQHGHLDVASYLILELGADVNTESPDKGFGSMLSQYGYLPGDHYPFSHGPPELVARHQMQQSKEEGVSTISPLYAVLRGFSRFDPSERMYPSSIAIEDEVKKANRNQQEELVMFLLGKGADVKFRAGQRLFPVQVAAKYCSERVLGMFFSVGADVNALGDPECRDELPIFFIARRELSTLSLVRQFVAAGAVVSKSLEEQTHLLEQTLRSFEGNISRKVFHSSIHLHDDRFLSASSLEYIFKEGPAAALFFMLSRMPQVQTTEVRWTLVLQMAAVLDDQCYVELLLRRGTDVNGTGYYYGTALQAAARFGNVKTMQKLLDAGAQVNLLQGLWQTPLRAALVHGSESTVQMLIDNGADVKLELFSPNDLYSASEAKLMSVLQLGVETRTLGIVERLLAEGVDPNHPVMMPQHPLIIAAKYGDFNIVKSLIASGALVDVKGKKRWSDFYMVPDEASPLHAASAGGHLDVIKLLLSCGATVDSSVENSGTPLKVASMNGQTKVVRHLLSVGAKADDEGALKSAVRNNHVEVVRELLAGGAIAATVLTTACRLGYLKMVETLVERVLDTEGSRTVLDEAFAVAGDQMKGKLMSINQAKRTVTIHFRLQLYTYS
ncbi:ankyrin repeat domain-containing protein [Colletotrichum tofieldiae]|uniref:Ankyrin repeat domain-containing protein n=1 Tax=Colletotrichum tofieldiae TaxID=708197 RepID=A0A166P4C0_9PEZI|nr:ankyrin repeat domain-containing protein [Colletotrichum tofieldiae]